MVPDYYYRNRLPSLNIAYIQLGEIYFKNKMILLYKLKEENYVLRKILI